MPMAAPKPCATCGALVRDGGSRCEQHRSKKTSNFSTRQTRQARGYGAAWDKLRKVVLNRDAGLCQVCRSAGRLTAGTIVDHKIPKAEGGGDELENLQTICKPCHDSKTALESARGGQGVSFLPAWLPAPRVPVFVVCGPPGSGKSTYVREHAAAGDLVLDVDEIAAEITGKPLYHASKEEVLAAVRVRNHRLAALADSGTTCSRAWLIVTAGTSRAREFWASKYGRPVHVMTTPKRECMDRIKADTRRPEPVQRQQIEAVLSWV